MIHDQLCGDTAFPSTSISTKSGFDSAASMSLVAELGIARARCSSEISDSAPAFSSDD